MDAVRPEASAPPARSVAGMGDHPSAMAFFGAIVTALYRRERTGEGAWVTSSLLANGVWSNGFLVQAKLCGASFTARPPRHAAPNALTNHYLCREGRWIILSLLNEDRQWPVFVRAIGRDDLLARAELKTTADRHARAAALVAILDAVFATKDLAEWRRILDGCGLTFGVVATLNDIPQDRQMRDAGVLVPFENEEMLTISSPFAIADAPKVAPRRAPAIGEHSAEVLRQAGYDEIEIARLLAAGVVGAMIRS
jgi:formyl-CoA transferase